MSDEVPAYDPSQHTLEGNPTVLLEMWCSCGMVHRQVDPVSHLLPQIDDFRAKHTGKGHGVAAAEAALAEREARREAGFRALGRHDEHERKDWTPGVAAFNWAATEEST